MKFGYHSLETVWENLEANDALGPILDAVLAMAVAGRAVLLGIGLHRAYKRYRIKGGLAGVCTRRKISALRAEGPLQGELTFADALDLTETGTPGSNAARQRLLYVGKEADRKGACPYRLTEHDPGRNVQCGLRKALSLQTGTSVSPNPGSHQVQSSGQRTDVGPKVGKLVLGPLGKRLRNAKQSGCCGIGTTLYRGKWRSGWV